MELDVLSTYFKSAHNILSACGHVFNTSKKAISMVISLKLIGLIGDILFGYDLAVSIERYSHPHVVNVREITLIIFFLGVPRILHYPIIIFGYKSIHPIQEYKALYYTVDNDDNNNSNDGDVDSNDDVSLNHIFKALWYGSIFLCDEYLEKIYASTHDKRIGALFCFILSIETTLTFFCVMLQSYILPRENKADIQIAVGHYLIVLWYIISSFFGLLQNWFVWYKVSSNIAFDSYMTRRNQIKCEHDEFPHIGVVHSDSQYYHNNDSVDEDVYKSCGQIWTFCICTVVLNAFSFAMIVFACCTGFGFTIIFTLWLEWNCSDRE